MLDAMTLAVVDTTGPRCIYQARPQRKPHGPRTQAPIFKKVDGKWMQYDIPIPVGPIEMNWRKMKPYFAGAVHEDQKPAPGTMKPLDAIAKYEDRDRNIQAIRSSCCCTYHANGGTDHAHKGKTLELETNKQELLRHGVSVREMNASSSDNDDSDDDSIAMSMASTTAYAVNIGTEVLDIPQEMIEDFNLDIKTIEVPVYKSIGEAAPYVSRIDWERYALACTDLHRIGLDLMPDGTVKINSTKRGHNPLGYAGRLKKMLGARTMPELMNDRVRVNHYGAVGSILYGKKSGPTPLRIATSTTTKDTSHDTFGFVPDQSILYTPRETCDHSASLPNQYAKCGRCGEHTGPVEKGPKELGQHWLTTNTEPPEKKLWPITLNEIVTTLRRELRLKPIELDWIDAHPEAYDTLREMGLVSSI